MGGRTRQEHDLVFQLQGLVLGLFDFHLAPLCDLGSTDGTEPDRAASLQVGEESPSGLGGDLDFDVFGLVDAHSLAFEDAGSGAQNGFNCGFHGVALTSGFLGVGVAVAAFMNAWAGLLELENFPGLAIMYFDGGRLGSLGITAWKKFPSIYQGDRP